MHFFHFDESGSSDHPQHRALIVLDDTSRQLNRAVAMKHAAFQRAGNRNMMLPAIVEYPFFTRSELPNGVQLADLLAFCPVSGGQSNYRETAHYRQRFRRSEPHG